MSSDRMMQALGRMERALTRIERFAEQRTSAPPRLATYAEAKEALRSLDGLIAELKSANHG